MAWTQDDIDELERVIATGARSVQKGDEIVNFRSQAEMIALLKRLKTSAAGQSGVRPARTLTPRTSRGF